MSEPQRESGKAERVRSMFARIVPRYDLMNALMTFGLDGRWRALAARLALPAAGGRALDVASGTGDLTLALERTGAGVTVGVDFCPEMLVVAREKAHRRGSNCVFVAGDALRLPFPDDSFDALTIGFGLRNFADVPAGLAEMARVLRPGGRFVCLEMTHPPFWPFARVFRAYFHGLVPLVGGVVAGDLAAYKYLPTSVDAFPPAPRLARMCESAGLRDVGYRYLAFGAVAVHSGVRAETPATPDPMRTDTVSRAANRR